MTDITSINLEILIVTATILISLKRFNEGGDAILKISSKNHQKLITGNLKDSPLFINNLRLLNRRYVVLVRKNKPEDANP
tara:strand:- start:2276 stop:2515 length:240 start_codon:yes stop_codon:yes gene_type:complete